MRTTKLPSPRSFALAALTLSILWTPVSRASSFRCAALFDDEIAKMIRPQQSSVEVEIGAAPAVIELMETTDGTIRPVTGTAGIHAIPEEILAGLQDYVGEGGDPLSASWDLLSTDEKASIIMRSAEVRGQKFFEARTVPGLRYRPKVSLTFRTKTRFLGVDYRPGTYTFVSSKIFSSTAIEFMGPERMRADLGFELHVRSDLAAGENYYTARSMQQALVHEGQNVHLHMVGKSPVDPSTPKPQSRLNKLARFFHLATEHYREDELQANAVNIYRSADFVRRAMLYFDIRMIENGLPMTTNSSIVNLGDKQVEAANFYPVDPADFAKFNKANMARGNGEDTAVKSKSGTVGVRTHHYYDLDVIGIEVRYLSPRLDPKMTSRDLSTFQDRLISGEYFLSPADAQAVLSSTGFKTQNLDQHVSELLYASNFEEKMNSRIHDQDRAFLMAEVKKNDFLKMLFHDWSQDPMFVGKPDRVGQIEAAQLYCIQMLERGNPARAHQIPAPLQGLVHQGGATETVASADVMKVFMKKSGIANDMKNLMNAAVTK